VDGVVDVGATDKPRAASDQSGAGRSRAAPRLARERKNSSTNSTGSKPISDQLGHLRTVSISFWRSGFETMT
jgi:hypothetical protein